MGTRSAFSVLMNNSVLLLRCLCDKGSNTCSVFFKFLSSRVLWKVDGCGSISSTYLDLWSNESSRRNLAEKPANFARCRLLYTTLHVWLLGDMEFLFFCSTQYDLTHSLHSLVRLLCSIMRYRIEHSKRNFWSPCALGALILYLFTDILLNVFIFSYSATLSRLGTQWLPSWSCSIHTREICHVEWL